MGFLIDTDAHGNGTAYDGGSAFHVEDRSESFVIHRKFGKERIEIEHRFLPALLSALLEVLGRNAETVSVPYRLEYSGLQERLKAMVPPDPMDQYDELPLGTSPYRLILTDGTTGETTARPEQFGKPEEAVDWVRRQIEKGEIVPSEFDVVQVTGRWDRKLPF